MSTDYTITTKVIERKNVPLPVVRHNWYPSQGDYLVEVRIDSVLFKSEYTDSVRGLKRTTKRLIKKAHKEITRRQAVADAHISEVVSA